MQTVEPDASSLAGWIKFNPKEFTFPPKSSQFVRYSIIPRGELQAGEYWGGIQFEPLTEQVASSTNGRGVSASIKVITSILVPIYGRYGDYTLSATIDSLEARRTEKGLLLRAIITNTCPGGLRIGGDYEITDAAGEQVSSGALTRSFILPRSTRIVKALVTQSLPPGVYTLSIQVRDRKTKEALAAGNTSFSIAAPPEKASK